jgi:transcriptional regulator with XRE-family HTH domain
LFNNYQIAKEFWLKHFQIIFSRKAETMFAKLIAEWFFEKRKEKGWRLIELSEKSGVTHATLSRIENQQSQVTLLTAVRVMHALELSWVDLFTKGFVKEGLPIPEIYLSQDKAIENYPCLNFNDLELLDSSGILRRGVAPSIVTRLISLFIEKYNPEIDAEKRALLAANFYSLLNVTDNQDGIARQYLPDLDFQYPQEFSPDALKKIYFSAGVFILSDLGRYVKYLRKSHKMTLRQVATSINISHPALIHFETNTSDKIKLGELINLDNSLELDGELIVFAWRTAELYLGVHRIKTETEQKIQPWTDSEIRLIEKLVTASRFFQHYFPEDHTWLDWYRQESLNGFENVIR